MKYDLSILIPARNEQFLARTVQDLLENMTASTEIIVGLDGVWAEPGIPDHERVTIVYYPKSIGQRAMTNQLAKLSKAKYVMKCDAHTSWERGFDTKMLAAFSELGDLVTMVPVLRNLHAFNWKCPKCASEWYQGPTPERCMKDTRHSGDGAEPNLECDNTTGFVKVEVWKPNGRRPQSTSFCFDPEPHFQYFHDYKSKQEGDLVETMSLQGSCFMMTRRRYWELDICDEKFGSWGSQGIEVAVKTWLAGGRVICNKRTWYAHMFRTQGKDFSFPYEMRQSKVEEAKARAKDLFFENKWEKQIRPLSWLIEKFAPVPGWTDEDLQRIKQFDSKIQNPSKGIVYFTDNQLNVKLAHAVQSRIRSVGIPIVSASLKRMSNMGINIVCPGPRGYESYFSQILTALGTSTADVIFLCEHDVLYHPSHFDFVPPDRKKVYYNHAWWKVSADGVAVHWDADQVSGLCAYRDVLLPWYRDRVERFDRLKFDRKFEPFSGEGALSWKSTYPNIDVRHGKNLTADKWTLADFRKKDTAVNFQSITVDDIPGWRAEQLRAIL